MTKENRRRFFASLLGATAGATAMLGSMGASPALGAADLAEPDLILFNGAVFTMEDGSPRAEAFAVKNGRFTAIGSSHDVRNLQGPRTQVIDVGGKPVFPGFIDAHSHPAWGGISELVGVDCDLRSIAAIQDAIHQRALKSPPGKWIYGFKYDDTKVSDHRPLTREDLDEAAPDNPVWIIHRGGHLSWYNTRAFALAGVTAQTADPEGGKFLHRNGQLDGCVEEKANDAFRKVIPTDTTPEQNRAGIALISKRMTSAGLTSVTDADCSPNYLSAYQDAYQAGEMLFRVYVLVSGYTEMRKGLESAGVRGQLGDDNFRIGGVKYLADGSAQERTMRMSTPYVGRPNDYGILTMNQDELNAAAEDANANYLQMGVHANGDVAIDMVLKAYERVAAKGPHQPFRPRIEHCTLVNPDLLARIKKLGAVPTPFYTYVYYHGDKWAQYGDDKLQWMFAHKSFLDYGIPVAAASDYIPGPYQPMMGLQSMVTRKDYAGRVWGANQRITVDQGLKVCTWNAAYASFDENKKGSIASGKLADFVILGDDPHTVDPDRLKDIPILRTVVGGKTVYSA